MFTNFFIYVATLNTFGLRSFSIFAQVLCDVREKLHIPPENPRSDGVSGGSVISGATAENADIAVLVFSIIRMTLLLNKTLTGAWMKVIGSY